MFAFILDILKALVTGEILGWWQAFKIRKAQNAQNDVGAMSDDDIARGLSKWIKKR